VKAVAILERDVSLGAGGIIYTELLRGLQGLNCSPRLIDYIIGLGGRDVTFKDIQDIAGTTFEERNADSIDNPIRWYQVRGLS